MKSWYVRRLALASFCSTHHQRRPNIHHAAQANTRNHPSCGQYLARIRRDPHQRIVANHPRHSRPNALAWDTRAVADAFSEAMVRAVRELVPEAFEGA